MILVVVRTSDRIEDEVNHVVRFRVRTVISCDGYSSVDHGQSIFKAFGFAIGQKPRHGQDCVASEWHPSTQWQ